jgi:hypothetical protein
VTRNEGLQYEFPLSRVDIRNFSTQQACIGPLSIMKKRHRTKSTQGPAPLQENIPKESSLTIQDVVSGGREYTPSDEERRKNKRRRKLKKQTWEPDEEKEKEKEKEKEREKEEIRTLDPDGKPDPQQTANITANTNGNAKSVSKAASEQTLLVGPLQLPAGPISDLGPAHSSILPVHLQSLNSKYDIYCLPITSSSKISTKVTKLLELLEKGLSWSKIRNQGIVALPAISRGGAAAKLVSIVEIALRVYKGESLQNVDGGKGKQKQKVYQFCGLSSVILELKESRKGKEVKSGAGRGANTSGGRVKGLQKAKRDKDTSKETVGEDVEMKDAPARPVAIEEEEAENEESDSAFETMSAQQVIQPTKVRNTPILTIYLSLVPVQELEREFG